MHKRHRWSFVPIGLASLLLALVLQGSSAAQPTAPPAGPPCHLLDDPERVALMSSAFYGLLLDECGRTPPEIPVPPVGPPPPGMEWAPEVVPPGGPDARVNAVDPPAITTAQSETSIARNADTGTLCVTWNDIYHVQEGLGICGYSRSTDGGLTWEDGGAMPPGPGNNTCRGDPSVAWHAADGYFYYTSLDDGGPDINGMSLWRSTDDCASFDWYGTVIRTGYEDKELLAAENNPASPYYGRIYLAWLNLNTLLHYASYSSDGLTWSPPVAISDPAERPGGAFPVVAPNGDLYVGWASWQSFPFGLVDQEIVRSIDGGDSFAPVTPPATNTTPPRDPTAEAYCNFIAIRGFMRYLPSLQMAITPAAPPEPGSGPDLDNYCLHVIYPYDPDGYGAGDAANVYYRRSCNQGQTWEPEVLLNDDGGLTDQFYPALTANEDGVVAASWYDRRNDPEENYYFERWATVSYDGGDTWEPNRKISDVASPVYIDTRAFCYHGDYDLMAADHDYAYVVWADGRVYFNGHYDQDIWFDRLPLAPDFELAAVPQAFDVCAPDGLTTTLNLGSMASFGQPVALSDSGVPPGVTTSFSANPVLPPGSSIYSLAVGAGLPDGRYAWNLSGEALTRTHQVSVTLAANHAVPAAPGLLVPPDTAIGLPRGHVTFHWSPLPEATSYRLQVDDDSAFGSPEADVVGIAGGSYTLVGPLEPGATYAWRVGADNACGEGAWSGAYTFTTAEPCLLLVDDDDNVPDLRPLYAEALDHLGYAYEVFDVGPSTGNGPGLAGLQGVPMVIWFSGDKLLGAGPNLGDEADLAAYLDGGGRLLLTSQDYLGMMGLTLFGQTYLGIGSFTHDGADDRVWSGVTGDPIGAGQTYFPTYPPDFARRPDIVDPGAGGSVAFKNRLGANLALHKDGGVWRTVVFGNAWEASHFINAAKGEEILGRIVDWFGGCPAAPPALAVAPPSLEAALYPDQSAVQALSITNAGGSDLSFSLHEVTRTLDAADLPWLAVEPTAGSLPPWASAAISVTFDAAGLPPELYLGGLAVESNDPVRPLVSVPLTLTVVADCDPVAAAAFVRAPAMPAAGEVVTFTGEATGTPPITFAWAFGDGGFGEGTVVTHTYAQSGTYPVVMIAANPCSQAVVEQAIGVAPAEVSYEVYLPLVVRE